MPPLKAILRGEGLEEPMEPLFHMKQRRVGPSRTLQESYNQPYFSPFGNQFQPLEWTPIKQVPLPNQLSFQWKNPQTQLSQGNSFQLHPTTQLFGSFPSRNWRP